MKKLLFILLLFVSVPLIGQNTTYIVFQPVDLGVGLRYDRTINNHNAIYSSISYGNYSLPNRYIDNHIKVSLGAYKYISKDNRNGSVPYVGGGINLNQYGETNMCRKCHKLVFFPVSIEFNVGLITSSRISVSIRYDPIKNESSIDFGTYFGKYNNLPL